MYRKKHSADPMKTAVFFVLTVFRVSYFSCARAAGEPITRNLSCVPPELDLPEIKGAFRLAFDASFNEIDQSTTFHSIFHWTSADLEDSIYLGHRNRHSSSTGARTELQIKAGGVTTKCRAYTDLSVNVLYSFEVMLFTDGSATINIKDVASYSCQAGDMSVPSHTTRQHYLGNSPFDIMGGFQRMKGGISGIQLTEIGTVTHPRDQFKFWNFPGQPYNNGFVVSFYARFDDLSSGRQWQMIFDFGNGSPGDNIWCSQRHTDHRMRCDVYDGSGASNFVLTDAGTLVEGEMDYWEFGVDVVGGRYWIQKNGSEIAAENNSVLPRDIFRRGQKFLHSHWSTDRLDGVVLGLRLTTLQTS